MLPRTMIHANPPSPDLQSLPNLNRSARPDPHSPDPHNPHPIADPLKPEISPDFSPDFGRPIPPKVEHELFLALADPSASLMDIANDFEISLEALTVWMLRPDIAARMESIAQAVVVRARFVAKSFLPAAARSAGHILALHQVDRCHNSKGTTGDPHNNRSDKAAMQASALLIRIASLGLPTQKSHIPSASPAKKRQPETPPPHAPPAPSSIPQT
ncbi:MAG: hypothetical protein JSR52_12510 [Planctomycetes bacterium]|nr:hypothetical protein [Planctomycetota bacterium]